MSFSKEFPEINELLEVYGIKKIEEVGNLTKEQWLDLSLFFSNKGHTAEAYVARWIAIDFFK